MPQPAIATLVSVEADKDSKLPERLHLLRSGKFPTAKYGDLDITADDLREFVDNFEKGYGRNGAVDAKGGLPVNFGHKKGDKAAAWIGGLEVDAEGNLWGKDLTWSKAGKESVEGHEFKFLSSEFTPRCLGGAWTNPENTAQKIRNVFTGAALTNIPMFSGNRSVMATAESVGSESEKQVIYINATEKEQNSMNLDLLRIKNAADLTAEEKKFVEAHASELNDDEKKRLGVEAAANTNTPISIEAAADATGVVSVEATELKKVLDENKTLKDKVEAAANTQTDLEKKVEAHSKQLENYREKEIKAEVKKHVARGAIVADQADEWVKDIIADTTNRTQERLEKLPSNKVVEAENIGADDKGEGGVSAVAIVKEKAKAIMASDEGKDLSIGDAISRVLNSEKDLAARYNQESQEKVTA